MKKILFVCTGNTCRSPMAEGILNSLNINGIKTSSAGICADKSPVTQNAVEVCAQAGIDISNHISKQLTKEMLDSADIIFCMNESHRQMLMSLTGSAEKIHILGGGIPDPFMGDETVYKSCYNKIYTAVIDFAKENLCYESNN